MYSCKVDPNFKVGFLKRSLNFFYDKQTTTVYSNDLKTLELLGLNKQQITEAYLSEHKDQENSNLKQQIEELAKKQIENQLIIDELVIKNKKIERLETAFKELVEYHKETETQIDECDAQTDETLKVLKNSIAILNKKIKEANEKIENMGIRTEAIIELLSEQAAVSKTSVNLLDHGITVEKIWKSTKNKSDAAILSIMFMMKKFLEDKGSRF